MATAGTVARQPRAATTIETVERVNQTWFNRDAEIPLYTWAILLQSVRMSWFNRNTASLNKQVMVVKTQALSFDRTAIPFYAPMEMRTTLDIGRIGKSSVEFITDVYARPAHAGDKDEYHVGQCLTILVVVNAERTQTGNVSPAIAAQATDTPCSLRPLSFEMRELRPRVADLPANAFKYELQVRYTDEDTLHHVNQANYVRFFEEAITVLRHETAEAAAHPALANFVSERNFGAMGIDYMREAKANRGPYFVVLERPSAHPEALDAYFVSKDTLHCRARFYPTVPDSAKARL